MSNETGPEAAVSGVIESAKGTAGEMAGALTGDDDLRGEGRAQQERAVAERDVTSHEAEAEVSYAEAEAHGVELQAHQR